MRAKPKQEVKKGVPLDLTAIDPKELLALVKKAGGQRAFSRKHNIPRTNLQTHLYKLRNEQFTHRPAPKPVHVGVKIKGIQRYILTSAQDNTAVHEGFLTNLEAYRDWLRSTGSCEIMVGGYTYSKKLFTDHDPGHSWFAERARPYLVHDRMRIADKIDFCGEMNTLPTAEKPLSGFETYTRERWGVFPHPKVQLVSVPTMKHDPVKMIMTTGSITKPNYLPKKAGIKASFHHVFGAVLVEVAPDGTFFCRHLLADAKTGAFYDLDRYAKDGAVTTGHRVEVMTPGDIHTEQIDPIASKALFGLAPNARTSDGKRSWTCFDPNVTPNLLDFLRPHYLMAHDILDFRRRNSHSVGDPDDRFLLYLAGTESVEDECREVAMLLTTLTAARPWLDINVVDSNHDQQLSRFLKTVDYKTDPVNARFILRATLAKYEAMARGDKRFSIFESVMKHYFEEWGCADITFLREDDSLRIGGVEHGNHGHRGLNGARGSTQSYAKIGPRVTIGHQHTCGILDGVYVAGTTSLMDLGYNLGPGSWSHTTVIQYLDGKRALVTICNGRTHL